MLRLVIIPFFLVFAFASNAFADFKQNQMVTTATQIVKIFNQDYNGSNKNYKLPKRFKRDRIKAIAIIPDLVKTGFLATYLEGEGIFCIKNADGSWSDPLFVKISGLGVGPQAGYVSSDTILLFDNTRSYSGLLNGTETLDLGADASILGGGTKRHMTDGPNIAANILALGRSNGVFLGISLDGARLQVEDQNNIDYYNRIYRHEDILNGSPRDKKQTRMLKQALTTTFNKTK